jgi:hypothetical protein
MDNWPFKDPKNAAAITVRQITDAGYAILRVSHDLDDGCWQFHTGSTLREEDAIVVSLESIVLRDPSVQKLADLPGGWVAWRASVGEEWSREPDQG